MNKCFPLNFNRVRLWLLLNSIALIRLPHALNVSCASYTTQSLHAVVSIFVLFSKIAWNQTNMNVVCFCYCVWSNRSLHVLIASTERVNFKLSMEISPLLRKFRTTHARANKCQSEQRLRRCFRKTEKINPEIFFRCTRHFN